jgi:hypothetical protein
MLFSGLVVAAAVALSAPAIAASVMSPAGVAAAANEAGVVEHVADGCGRGWWRGPDGVGRCRPRRVGPPVVVVPRLVVPGGWCHRPYSSRNVRC